MTNNKIIVIVLVLLIILGIYKYKNNIFAPRMGAYIGSASYSCNLNKTIEALFYNNAAKEGLDPEGKPIGTGSVVLKLSDGRNMTLSQTISASGVRYANQDESFVFWNKGNGALVLENNEEKSFIGCIIVKPAADENDGSKPYVNNSDGFSLRIPLGYVVDDAYVNQVTQIKRIGGVKFTIPSTFTEGTNLSKDTYIALESIPNAKICSANLFAYANFKEETVTDSDNVTYSVVKINDAAAGNRYEEIIYAIVGTNPCMAVRYFIHYGAIGNYPEGSVVEFNKENLLDEFDKIRRSITLNQ